MLLGIYLNDHLAGATAGSEQACRVIVLLGRRLRHFAWVATQPRPLEHPARVAADPWRRSAGLLGADLLERASGCH